MGSRVRSWFVSSPVGHAHIAAARAVAAAMSPDWEHEELDYLAFLPLLERTLWPGLYHAALRHAPSLWRAWRTITDKREPRALRDRVSDAGAAELAARIATARPRVVVSTIGAGASLAGAARERAGAEFVNALVVTHFRAHRHWARPEADVVFVANDQTRADLIERGIAGDRVIVSGTPLRPGLRRLDDTERAALRAKLGVTGPLVVASTGGTGAYRALNDLLASLESCRRELDVAVFAGPARGIEQRGRMRVHFLGFRDDFCDWLAACDACVGKLGSLTAAEACAVGAPIVVYDPIPGPEEANAALLVHAGAARWPRTASALRATVLRVLDGDGAALADAAARLHKPDAAARIAAELEARAC